jgi:hypothetical protein
MIDIKYSKAILNMLFVKGADGGTSPYAEKESFLNAGIPESVTGRDIHDATSEDEEKFNTWKKAINDSVYWETKNYNPYITNGDYVYGWQMVRKLSENSMFYPASRYLALFTTMPDKDGKNFVEPSNETTYKRVDLNSGYFSKSLVMTEAALDSEKGGTFTHNDVTIYFPEIRESNWTQDNSIVGFGIFESEIPVEGEVPYLWGKLNNTEAVEATIDHVPLFRKEQFELSIS